MDHELAHLIEEYFEQGGADIMRPRPAIHRVIPAQSAVKTEWILPYDKLKELLLSCNTFRVRDCICRKQQELEGTKKCSFPLHVELIFYTAQARLILRFHPMYQRKKHWLCSMKQKRSGWFIQSAMWLKVFFMYATVADAAAEY